jgi:hypothetical protein
MRCVSAATLFEASVRVHSHEYTDLRPGAARAGRRASAIVNLPHAEILRAIATKTVADRLPDYELIANTRAEFAGFPRKDAELTRTRRFQRGSIGRQPGRIKRCYY